MPYKFLPEVAVADIAIEITGKTLDELFRDAAMAVEEQTVNLDDLKDDLEKEIKLEAKSIETLLYDFLSELIFMKDTDQFLFKSVDVNVDEKENVLHAVLKGDLIDPERQELRNDIKAITMHMFSVEQKNDGWKATVVVDV